MFDRVEGTSVTERVSRRKLLQALAASTSFALAGCGGSRSGSEQSPPGTEPTPTATPATRPRRANGGGAGETQTPEPQSTTDEQTTTAEQTEETLTETERQYGSIVDVTDAGADPTGSEPCTEVLRATADDDTLLQFPDGTYSVGRLTLSNYENLGLRAAPDATPTLVPAAPVRETGSTLLKFIDVGQFAFEGFTLDFREDGFGGMFYLLSHGDFLVRDLTVEGSYPPDVTGFRFEVVDAGSTGRVENLVARGGSIFGSESVGVFVGYSHAGELFFEDCEIANFPNNGLYASAPGRQGSQSAGNGPVHVRGGEYINNNIANIRLGSTGSSVSGARVVVDRVPPHKGPVNARGIRLRARENHLVEDCEIVLTADAGVGFGALVVHSDASNLTVRNTRIQVDRDGLHAVNMLRDENGSGSRFENVTLEGTASAGETVAVRGRSDVHFEDCEIVQTGGSRDGILFDTVDDCSVADSRINVTGRSIVDWNSTITRRGLSLNEETNEQEETTTTASPTPQN